MRAVPRDTDANHIDCSSGRHCVSTDKATRRQRWVAEVVHVLPWPAAPQHDLAAPFFRRPTEVGRRRDLIVGADQVRVRLGKADQVGVVCGDNLPDGGASGRNGALPLNIPEKDLDRLHAKPVRPFVSVR